MKIRFKQYDFVNWTVREFEREIDVDECLKHNALLRYLMADEKKADENDIRPA